MRAGKLGGLTRDLTAQTIDGMLTLLRDVSMALVRNEGSLSMRIVGCVGVQPRCVQIARSTLNDTRP